MPRPDNSTTWAETISGFTHPRVITMLFLGFSAGLPLLLIFSSLSLWLREAGMDRAVVTFFSWAALGYSFKFVWAPLVDSLPLPILTRLLGRRRSWMIFAQGLVMVAIVLMSSLDPAAAGFSISYLAFAAVMLGFSSATQDIVIDAYRIESAEVKLQALMSSTYIAGYRIGMLVAGAGALYLASYFGSTEEMYSYGAWQKTYLVMASCMLVGIITVLLIPEPGQKGGGDLTGIRQQIQVVVLFLCCVAVFIMSYLGLAQIGAGWKATLAEMSGNRVLGGVLVELVKLCAGLGLVVMTAAGLSRLGIVEFTVIRKLYLNPVTEFFSRYGLYTAFILLCLVGLYRISDIVLGVIANIFYQDLGFTKNEIATVSKVFGLLMTLLGGFIGGLSALRFGVMKTLLAGAVLSAATNLLFMTLAKVGYDLAFLYLVIGADSLCAGIASVAFVAFLSSLTSIQFTAMQFAIFTSIMTLIPKVLGGYSGGMVNTMGYSGFFLLTAVLGIPVVVLIILVSRDSRFS
ncbi:MAG: MFS transporter [Gammaproteobacteria bacterium]|nr:MFS transporter [Gammaproteobacteria bacterium]